MFKFHLSSRWIYRHDSSPLEVPLSLCFHDTKTLNYDKLWLSVRQSSNPITADVPEGPGDHAGPGDRAERIAAAGKWPGEAKGQLDLNLKFVDSL